MINENIILSYQTELNWTKSILNKLFENIKMW